MPDYPVIDAHMHTYATPEVGRQAQEGRGVSGHAGTVDEYLQMMDGIETAVMVNMTPVADMRDAMVSRGSSEEEAAAKALERMRRRNAWTCEVARENKGLMAFVSVDPEMGEESALEELTARVKEGARGIKLHPENQRYFPADRRLWPVYEEAQRLELPIISHSGIHIDQSRPAYAQPANFAEVLEHFPKLTLVLAHLGHGFLDDSFALAEQYPNVFFDCSFVVEGSLDPPVMSDEEAMGAFRRIGIGRVLFGSDWPWRHPLRDAERVAGLPLTDDEKRQILRENARRVLAL